MSSSPAIADVTRAPPSLHPRDDKQPFLAPSHKTTVKKVIGFVEWLQRSDKVRQFEVAERTFRAPKALSSEQLQGKFSFKSR